MNRAKKERYKHEAQASEFIGSLDDYELTRLRFALVWVIPSGDRSRRLQTLDCEVHA